MLELGGEAAELGFAFMPTTFDIVLGTAGLVVAIGLVLWGFIFMLQKSYEPGAMLMKWVFTIPFVIGCIWLGLRLGFFGPFVIVFMGVVLSYMWTPHLSELVAGPLANLFDGGNAEIEPKPYYSIAKGKQKRGKYTEAIAEIREQLEKFPNDFEGVTLLANIQAENLKDLQAAENTFNHFCDREEAPPKQVAAAWTQLADWYLKIGVDVDSARAMLQRLIDRYPGTEIALAAEQRIAHLGGAEKILMAQHDRQSLAVPEGVNNIGLLDSSAFLQPQDIEPGKLAAAHVKHLEEHPHDSEVREKLATIYARDFKRLDLATMELAQLINEPRHSPKQVATWLNLLANFQMDLGADVETVRETLEKIVERFPNLPLAAVAQRRLSLLNLEFKGKEKTPDVKLGVYEQNIGLKYGGPRR